MTRILIHRTLELEGEEIRVAEGVLYVDGKRIADFPDEKLVLESDGTVSIRADIPVFASSLSPKTQAGTTAGASSAGASSTVHVSLGDPEKAREQAEKIVSEVQENMSGIAGNVLDSLARAFPPGFPFPDRKKK